MLPMAERGAQQSCEPHAHKAAKVVIALVKYVKNCISIIQHHDRPLFRGMNKETNVGLP